MSEKAKLYAALAKAQAQIEGARKGKTNPHLKSAYADLASVWDACREALTSNGLSIIQRSVGDDPQLVQIETILCHESGAEVSGTITMRPVKADPQGIGSCMTYARRYSLAAMVGVAPEDDDGNAASQGEAPKSITAKQAAQIKQELHDTESDVPAFLAAVAKAGGISSIESVDDIPASLHATCMTALKKKRQSRNAPPSSEVAA
jgi:ERF superfamily.